VNNWKEALISDCITLERKRTDLLDAEESDEELVKLRHQSDVLAAKITALSNKKYCDQIDTIDSKIASMHDQLIVKWDIAEKTYECEGGSATMRTTKSLKITDKKQLISVLLNIDKLPEAIRSWNLSYLRKLKDVGKIEDTTAHYEEAQNVVIKEAVDK